MKTTSQILIALVLSTSFGACRLGNRVEEAKTVSPYSAMKMAPYQLILCTKLTTDTNATCDESTLSDVTDWNAYITNPILFYQTDKNATDAYLISSDLKKSLPAVLDSASASTFYHYSYTSPVAFFHHTACVTQMVNYGEGTSHLVDGQGTLAGYSLQGTMDLIMQSEHLVSGDCAQSFTEALACYNDTTVNKAACGMTTTPSNQSEYAYVHAFFDKYILRGLMDATDIPNISEVYYQISYR